MTHSPKNVRRRTSNADPSRQRLDPASSTDFFPEHQSMEASGCMATASAALVADPVCVFSGSRFHFNQKPDCRPGWLITSIRQPLKQNGKLRPRVQSGKSIHSNRVRPGLMTELCNEGEHHTPSILPATMPRTLRKTHAASTGA